MRDFVAGQLELRHGRAGDPGGLSNLDLTRSGQRQSAVEAATEDVGGGHASADEFFDAVGCFDCGVGGVGASLLRGLGQGVDVLAGIVAGGGDAAHRLVKVGVLAGDQGDGGTGCGARAEHGVGDLVPVLLVLRGDALQLLPLAREARLRLEGLVNRLTCRLGGLRYVVGTLRSRCHRGEILVDLALEDDGDGTAGHGASLPARYGASGGGVGWTCHSRCVVTGRFARCGFLWFAVNRSSTSASLTR